MMVLSVCLSLGHQVRPVALFCAQRPGAMCDECGEWMELSKRQFRQFFGMSFPLPPSLTIRIDRPRGNAHDRRIQRRAIRREMKNWRAA